MSSRRQLVAPALHAESDHRQARVIDMRSARVRLDLRDRDSILNALWEELTRLTHEAWSWRDPESIEALQMHIAHLKAHVLEDWQK